MRALALALFLPMLAGSAWAQEPPAPTDGVPRAVRVRLGSDEMVQGFLRGHSADEVVVYTSAGKYRHIALSDVRSFEVRRRTGSQLTRGAIAGLLVWGSIVATNALDVIEEHGAASWQSGALLVGATGVGAAVGHGIPRYGWVATDPRHATAPARSLLRVTLRF